MNVNAASELKDYGNEEKLNCWRCCLLHCAPTPAESHLKPCRAGRDVLGGTGVMVPAPQASPCCSHDSAACLEVSCHHGSLCSYEGTVIVSSDRPGCDPKVQGWDPCTTTLAAANPLRLPQRAPSHPLTHWGKSPDSFFPPLCLPRERKKEFEIICWLLVLHHIQLVLEQ